MSSKRGRKRNDNLPPNRARDVQRAFRARRAAHLQALEQRVSELEEENSYLRQVLNIPPSNRPPLGKGPTGKDKPRVYNGSSSHSLAFHSSRESSLAESPPSRAGSQSPTSMTVSMSPSRPMHVLESGSWNDPLLMGDHNQEHDLPGPSDAPYQLASPMSTPLPIKSLQYPPYPNSLASSSRNSLPSRAYINNATSYPHSSDRPLTGNYGPQNFQIRDEIREDAPRPQYSYPQTSFPSHDSNIQSQSSSPGVQSHPHAQHSTQRGSPLPFLHRRNVADSHGFSLGQGFPHLPNPVRLQANSRPPDYTDRPQDLNQALTSRSPYGADGRLNPMP